MKLHRFSFFVGAAASALALTLASGLGLGAAPIAAQTVDVNAVQAAAQKAQVMAVTYQLDTSDFHALDESLAAGQMVPGALGKVRRARIATEATMWPHAMEETGKKLVAEMKALEAALRDEKVAEAAPYAKAVHDVAHDLSGMVYDWLAGVQPAPHDHDESKPGH